MNQAVEHAAGLYAATPRDTDLGAQDAEDAQAFLAGAEPVAVVTQPTGIGTIETYTVIHNRDGSPDYAVVYGKTEEGLRFVARTPPDRAVFEELTTSNQVGRSVHLRQDRQSGRNLAEFA